MAQRSKILTNRERHVLHRLADRKQLFCGPTEFNPRWCASDEAVGHAQARDVVQRLLDLELVEFVDGFRRGTRVRYVVLTATGAALAAEVDA